MPYGTAPRHRVTIPETTSTTAISHRMNSMCAGFPSAGIGKPSTDGWGPERRRARRIASWRTRVPATGVCETRSVLEHRDLAAALARRYRGRGEPIDDLEQVAFLGLVKAVERFDPDRGIAFPNFAVPTIAG